MTKTEQKEAMKELFVKGRAIKLGSGEDGVFSRWTKGKTGAWVIIGDAAGMTRVDMREALCRANFPAWDE